MSNAAPMSDLQRTLWLAWYEAEKAVSYLMGKKPVFSGHPEPSINAVRSEAHRDAMFTWREDWNQALGFRDGLHKACVIAGVPNFKDD